MPSSTSGSNGRTNGLGALLLRSLLFALLVLGALVLVALFGIHGSPVDYMEAVRTKADRLATLPSPKLVIVGGSNTAMGLDSKWVEEATCKPVVNMGVHASLGFAFMVNQLKSHLGPGDVVIILPEYTLFDRTDKVDDVLYMAVDRYPRALLAVPGHHWPKVIGTCLVMRLRGLARTISGRWASGSDGSVYGLASFDERGDLTRHLHMPTKANIDLRTPEQVSGIIGPHFRAKADELVRDAGRVGAVVLFGWPGMARSAFPSFQADQLDIAMREAGFSVVGKPYRHVLPDHLMFDSRYHPVAEGRELRSERFVDDLCSYWPQLCCTP